MDSDTTKPLVSKHKEDFDREMERIYQKKTQGKTNRTSFDETSKGRAGRLDVVEHIIPKGFPIV